MSEATGPEVCEHGELHRSCPICERDDRIAELEAENRKLLQYVCSICGEPLLPVVDDGGEREGD